MEEREVVRRLLRATPSKFNALTLSLEQYGDLDKISLNEVIGSLSVHKLQLKELESQEEESNLINHKFNITIARSINTLLMSVETLMPKLKIWRCLDLERRLQSLRVSLKKVNFTNTSLLLKFTQRRLQFH
ncbi:unnamed protein product [Spirodela intermedia]|uniref:Uncharacterized protein n=1 Tax=Spirodela intermedia TaxID=51605 RepID=A0A7I8KHR6_SPIIN|nr:unnamed protein product [Spirodela intermedia]